MGTATCVSAYLKRLAAARKGEWGHAEYGAVKSINLWDRPHSHRLNCTPHIIAPIVTLFDGPTLPWMVTANRLTQSAAQPPAVHHRWRLAKA